MEHLLLKSTFDSLAFIEGEINTYNRFQIDGYLQKEFFEEPPEREFSDWKEIKEFCYSLIRGKRTPLNFRFILSLPRKNFPAFLKKYDVNGLYPDQIQGLYLNFKFEGASLTCTTGLSLKAFTMDKSLEMAWDAYVEKWFRVLDIEI